MASYSKAVTGTAVMARSANEEKKKKSPKRFILGLYAPGKKTNSTQLVIRLTPIPAADPNAGAASASSLRTSRPLTLDEAEPFGVYFFQSGMLRVLTREGIRPNLAVPLFSRFNPRTTLARLALPNFAAAPMRAS